MRCAIVSDYGYEGGAAIAANRLCAALQNQSVEAMRFATLFLGSIQGTIGDWSVQPTLLIRFANKFARRISDREWEMTWLRPSRVQKLVYRLQEFKPDVISLHNIHGAGLQPGLLKQLVRISPVAWTLHDMWAITGGCAHAFTCQKYITGCDHSCQCKWPMSNQARHLAKHNWQLRANVYRELKNVVFVTPSRWLSGECRKGLLKDKQVHTIPNGLDLEEFYPIPKVTARESLGVPAHSFAVLFSAAWLSDTHKGFIYLVHAMNKLVKDYPGIWLITIGEAEGKDFFGNIKFRHTHLGRISDSHLMRLVYSVADVYALPSLAENFPNTLVEALACGTPCVGFDVGGVSEIIRPGETGFLAQPENSESLAHSLHQVLDLDLDEWQALSQRCRQVAEAEYSLDLYTRRHMDLFESLLNTR
jgi:glycosyltransferase involved in cell wall biosynthesis